MKKEGKKSATIIYHELAKESLLKNASGEHVKSMVPQRDHVTVCFTNKNIHAQCIDDEKGHTMAVVSTNNSEHKTFCPTLLVQ